MASNITHVLFDLDGTLINSPQILLDIIRDYAKSHGKVLPIEIEADVPNVTDMAQFINKLLHSLNLVLNETDLKQLYHDFLTRFVGSTQFALTPGAERLVKHLHRHGVHMAIATGRKARDVAHYRSIMKPFLDDGLYFSHCVAGGDDPDVTVNKPDPHVYHICAKRFAIPPKSIDNVLIVEDSLTGITGAVQSGMQTLLINDQKYCSFDTIAEKITVICKTFDDFRPESLGLPPYDN